MKKFLIPVLAIVLAVLVLIGTLVYLLLALPKAGRPKEPAEQTEAKPVADYLAETWPDFALVRCEDGVLTLQYQVKGSYEQIAKHGAAAGYGELAEGHLDTAELIRRGCMLQCGLDLTEIIVVGQSEDDQEVYRASTVTGVTACWEK